MQGADTTHTQPPADGAVQPHQAPPTLSLHNLATNPPNTDQKQVTARDKTPENSVTQRKDMGERIAAILLKLQGCDQFPNLTQLLTSMLDTEEHVTETMKYIRDKGSAQDMETYEHMIFVELKRISNTEKESDTDAKLKATGAVKTSSCMCFFVCGFIQHEEMSFINLVTHHRDYADGFFDYMIKTLHVVMRVSTTVLATEYKTMEFTDDEKKQVSGPRYICAEVLETQHMHDLHYKNVLVLDAFTYTDQYLQYHPVVWYLYCLWYLGERRVHCYGLRSDKTSYLFIGHWGPFVENVLQTRPVDGDDAKHVVKDLVLQPFYLYRHTMQSLNTGAPTTVISKLRPVKNLHDFVPLMLAHLLVQPPDVTMYIDCAVDDLEQILAFAASKTKQQIFAGLKYERAPTPITHDAPVGAAYADLAKSHYDLMMAHRFVIPYHAKPEQILFDPIPAGGHSQHLDFIDALCRVRYNWVFDTINPLTNPSKIHGIKPDEVNTYHVIDVHRHITHLMGTEDDLLKPLHTGCRVQEMYLNPRSGVIVFDVQEVGRIKNYFKGHDPNVRMLNVSFTDTTNDCIATLNHFAHDSALPSVPFDHEFHKAMRDYFQMTTLPDLFSLCDMAFKYVVRTDDGSYFMQDSFELQQIDSNITQNTFDRCHRCPVCLKPNADMKAAGQNMYLHITHEHPAYPIADVLDPPLDVHEDRTSDQELADTAQRHHTDGSSSGDSPPSTLTGADMSHRSNAPESGPNHQLVQEMHRIKAALLGLKATQPRRPDIEAGALVAVSEANYEKLQEHCRELERHIDDNTHNLHKQIDELTQTLEQTTDSMTHHLDEAQRLRAQVSLLNEQHKKSAEDMNEQHRSEREALTKQHEEALKQQLQPYIDQQAQYDADILKLREQITGLQKMLQEANAKEPQNADTEELERLRRENQDLRALPDAQTKDTDDQVRALQLQLAAHEAAEKSHLHSDTRVAQLNKIIREQQKTIASLRTQITEYHKALTDLRKQLEALQRSQQADARELHETVSKAVHKQIDNADLVPRLQARNFLEIRAAVLDADVERVKYQPCTLFLILESMGATWHTYLRIRDKPKSDSYDAKCKLIVEQMLYDLRMWDSIANDVKPTRYTSHHVTAFIKHFGLDKNPTHTDRRSLLPPL